MDIVGVGAGQVPVNNPVAVPPEQAAENRDLVQAVRALNASGSLGEYHELSFMLDRNTKLPVIRIVNRETKEVVDQIPPEYLLRLAKQLREG